MRPVDAAAVLGDLPPSLWPPLLQAVRQAADRLGRSQLPAALRPYAGFTPQALGDGRARRAVIDSLVRDARLREAVGRALGEPVWHHAEEAPGDQLVDRYGAGVAAAALVSRARWDDLAQIAAEHGPEEAPPPPPSPAEPSSRDEDARAAMTSLRREREAAVRREAAARRRADKLETSLGELRQRVAELERERDAALRRVDDERRRGRDRLARLQRRAADAESRARVDVDRLATVAADLERLASDLRAVPGDDDDEQADDHDDDTATGEPGARGLPRRPAVATAGRPSVLPPGLTPEQPAAVTSLLDVPGVTVIVDGYNVTKDVRGIPTATLAEQRAWLERLLAGVAAGRDAQTIAVFDGDRERTSAVSAARGVRCVYTAGGETADERIVGIVDSLPPQAPVVVVTSDREVAGAVEERGVNVVSSGDFLRAVA